jgi:hypothetical protein
MSEIVTDTSTVLGDALHTPPFGCEACLRHANLVHPSRRKDRSEDCSTLVEPEKKDLILCTESPESELTDSADRSLAREGHEQLRLCHRDQPPRRLLTNSAFS